MHPANPPVRIWSPAPLVCTIPGVAAPSACRAIKEYCLDRLLPSPTISGRGSVVSTTRTSDSYRFESRDHALCQPLLAIFAEFTGDSLGCFERPTVIRYRAGQYYQAHLDTFNPSKPAHQAHLELAGQRVNTYILYLEQAGEGGETHFSQLDVSIVLPEGGLLVFHNLDEHRMPSVKSLHESLPVHRGEKWILTTWSRERPMA